MSPEQMMGGTLDARTDLFSLASVAFEAFTGQRAFQGETLRDICNAITLAPPPRPTAVNPSLPRALDAWFAKACARDPNARFASARELIAALYQAFAPPPQPVHDEPAPNAQVIAPRGSRLGLAAVIVAVVVAIAVVLVFSSQQ
jgi:serine/threonine-protein kinase